MKTACAPRTNEPSSLRETVTTASPTSRNDATGTSTFRILIAGEIGGLIVGLPLELRLRGHKVECARTGAEALKLAHAFQPEFVLIDASLPDLSGFEIAALLPAVIRSGQVRIASVSGCGGDDRSLSQAAGCVSHLLNPVDFAEIEVLLAECGARMRSYFRMSGPSAGAGKKPRLSSNNDNTGDGIKGPEPGVVRSRRGGVLTPAYGSLGLPLRNMPPQPLGNPHFPTTRWTGVLRLLGADDSACREEALSSLCRDYWYPLYAFARRLGRSPEDAEDLTQGFLAYVLEHDVFSMADRNVGTLRTFLLRVFQRYIGDVRDREMAQKRGGGKEIVSLNLEGGEELYSRDLATHDTPESLFDRSWAQSLLRTTLSTLAAGEQEAGRGQQFEILSTFLTPDAVSEQCYEDAGREAGLSPEAVRQAVCRLRKKFRECLREQIAATLHEPDDARIDAELSALRAALRQ
jgi:RNA polymerase sigma factor (sigma-70 family)